MSNIVGSVTRTIFKSDNDYYVLVFKVKENDVNKEYNGKFINVTGYFYDIDENIDLSLTGEFGKHSRYGEQFNVSSYQKVIPEDKNSIVAFFSSGLFKGIGEAKALKIYEQLGDEAIDLIKKDKNVLREVKSLSEKNILTISKKIQELDNSTDTLLSLTELGFNSNDATMIYKNYKEKTIEVINNDIYTLFYDLEKISFQKIDRIALKNKFSKNDERRIRAGIVNTMRILGSEKGDTYFFEEEIYKYLKIIINYETTYDDFLENLNILVNNLRIVKIDLKYQLMEYFEADSNIVKRLTYLNNKEDITYKKDYLDRKISEFEKTSNIIYDENQKEAIKKAFIKNFLIITGGPGTGKTTIIKSIVSMYRDIFNLKYDLDDEVVLLAPTGRASKRIMEATTYKASTIHRFLKWNKDTNKFQVNEYNKSNAKLVIIDDSNQLPSVLPGEVLKDLIDSEVFSLVKLKNLYRQSDDSSIINLAYDVNNGEVNYDLFNQNQDLVFYKADSDTLREKLILIAKDYKNVDYHDFQIMAPMYKTLNGINNLNQILQEVFNPKSSKKEEIEIYDVIYRVGDKVLQLMNMPDDNVYNGDIGIIIKIDTIKKEVTIDYDGNIVTFTKATFGNFTLGYVISIHKSQGSEFKTVLIPILKEYGRMLYRKLVYTGITRSKQRLILIGEAEAFQKGVLNNNNNERKTDLCEKIKQRYS